jgi:hypothetical protein
MLAYATLPPRRIQARITALVFVVHLANASVAAWIGYLSPDSWHYLRLAKSLYVNGYPSLHGTSYFAVFPFGYPLLLALVSPGLDLTQTAVVSKFANAGLWISAYFVLKSLRISPVLAAALVTTPFSLRIAAITWSENLMLLALILTLAGIHRLQEETSRSRPASILFLLAALLLGIASRYVFGFLILGFATAYLISFRKALRPHIFLVFAVSECFFVLYLLVNLRQTGYSTGMERFATTDTISYLVFTFAKANFQLLLSMLLPVAAMAFLMVRHWRLNPMAIMTALVGVAYLAIIVYLRWHTQFDPFDQRLLGPGWFLLTLALVLAARTVEPEARHLLGSIGLLCLSLWAGYWVHGITARDLIERGEAWTSSTEVLRNHAQTFHGGDEITSVISVAVPSPRVSVDADPLYYGDLRVFIPARAPSSGRPRETLDAFRARVLAAGTDIDHCAVDFSHLASEEQLSEILDARYRTGLTQFEARFDSALAGRFRKIFRARAFVPCREFLKHEPSR